MHSDQKGKPGNPSKIWDRYWSVMFVGEHGQVVPFKRFKSMAIGVISALVVLLVVVIALAAVLAKRAVQIKDLEAQFNDAEKQIARLRDEKDLLLTKMVIKKEKTHTNMAVQSEESPEDMPLTVRKSKAAEEAPVPATAPLAPAKAETSKPTPVVAAELNADARQTKVAYQHDSQMLSISFRIYNTSQPKVPLSGRSVVVFKNQDDPPIQWMAVPRVQLVDGKPTGKRGKAFKINNYRTVVFKAYNQKTPVRFNMATIFIFSSKGELLMTKDHGFKIEAPPAPKPVIPKPKPKPAEAEPIIAPETISPNQPPAVPDASAKPDGGETVSDPGNQPVAPPSEPGDQQQTQKPQPSPEAVSPTPAPQTDPDASPAEASSTGGTSGQGTTPAAETQPEQSQPTNQGDQQ